jgi:ketosteroid isomerase-like protein
MRQDNIDLVRGVYGAYVTGDKDTVINAFDPDVAWHVSGYDANAGTYHGVPAVMDYLMGQDHMDDYALSVTDMLASDERVAVVATTSGRRGEATIRNDFVQLIRIRDGRIVEVWNYNWDQRGIAEFMAVPL